MSRFANVGGVVDGDQFFGRGEELAVLANRLLCDGRPGNVAICGLPKSGKSSLLAQFLLANRAELAEIGRLWVPLRFSTCESAEDFFFTLVRTTQRIVRRSLRERDSHDLDLLANEIRPAMSWVELTEILFPYFESLSHYDLEAVVVIDEFDHARTVFEARVAAFQTLRELAYQPSLNVCLVTASRRPISAIEASASISTLDGISSPIWVRPLTGEDGASMRQAAADEVEGGLSDEHAGYLEYLAGDAPYLIGVVGSHLRDSAMTGRGIADGFERARSQIAGYFDRLRLTVDEFPNWWETLVRLIRPDDSGNVSMIGLQRMVDWGIVLDVQNRRLLSEFFADFVSRSLSESGSPDNFPRATESRSTGGGLTIAFGDHSHGVNIMTGGRGFMQGKVDVNVANVRDQMLGWADSVRQFVAEEVDESAAEILDALAEFEALLDEGHDADDEEIQVRFRRVRDAIASVPVATAGSLSAAGLITAGQQIASLIG